MFKDGALDLEMGQAVAGIKGTTLVLEEINGTSRLKVIKGEAEFTSKATGEKTLVRAGEEIYADKSGLGPKTGFNIDEELKNGSLRTLLSRAGHKTWRPRSLRVCPSNTYQL